jgi:hypothetical protein
MLRIQGQIAQFCALTNRAKEYLLCRLRLADSATRPCRGKCRAMVKRGLTFGTVQTAPQYASKLLS